MSSYSCCTPTLDTTRQVVRHQLKRGNAPHARICRAAPLLPPEAACSHTSMNFHDSQEPGSVTKPLSILPIHISLAYSMRAFSARRGNERLDIDVPRGQVLHAVPRVDGLLRVISCRQVRTAPYPPYPPQVRTAPCPTSNTGPTANNYASPEPNTYHCLPMMYSVKQRTCPRPCALSNQT